MPSVSLSLALSLYPSRKCSFSLYVKEIFLLTHSLNTHSRAAGQVHHCAAARRLARARQEVPSVLNFRTTTSHKSAAVPKRARISGSWTFVSLNSRLDSNKEEKKREGQVHHCAAARRLARDRSFEGSGFKCVSARQHDDPRRVVAGRRSYCRVLRGGGFLSAR